jgi:hypothetical protein
LTRACIISAGGRLIVVAPPAVIERSLAFELAIEDTSGAPPVVVTGSIDRIDRLPSGGVEVIDDKDGQGLGQMGVDEAPNCRSTPSHAATPWASAPCQTLYR